LHVRLTEELSEIAYIDQVKLIAVDHPESLGLYINEKFQGPPYPDLRIYNTRGRRYPVAARDHLGRDVLHQLLRRDRTYPEAGAIEIHFDTITPDNSLLILSGWVDWADGSTFLAYSQQDPRGLMMPRLEALDSHGRWRTILDDMGMPAGKPKTIAVDLKDKLRPGERRLRIVTNLALYWDEIFLTADAGQHARTTTLLPSHAGLNFRGFSRALIHSQRKQPEMFFYNNPLPVSMWNPTPGLYTRYGDVRELTLSPDDRFLIMGSGDELQLQFDASALPPLPPGMRRDFLLAVDGWAKDRDANTAFSQSVEPLPFHNMTRYPYPDHERFPDTEAHNAWRRLYNTRPALRLIRPLKGD